MLAHKCYAAFILWMIFPSVIFAINVESIVLDACPGYRASDIKTNGGKLTANLHLAGKACNVFGEDLQTLSLTVLYETSMFSM